MTITVTALMRTITLIIIIIIMVIMMMMMMMRRGRRKRNTFGIVLFYETLTKQHFQMMS